ncbi:helix-turn-helix domain-containing protein [Streptomyces sp. NA04227]|uniref:transcriptional regulator n=1 Tax=Streptomyces sp. NA04227 TaxID=2742136 RepID=UPI0015924F79|nr:transcriptional regulator [Streptomyces sp. NA04227]QKW08724.1 helix-turn-helix domain-containing protein [Streptomyces sp. NA04227]
MTQTPEHAPLPSPAERRRLRRSSGLSRAALAARLGVSGSCLRRWESGREDPEGEQVDAYVRALDVTDGGGSGRDGEPGEDRATETTEPDTSAPPHRAERTPAERTPQTESETADSDTSSTPVPSKDTQPEDPPSRDTPAPGEPPTSDGPAAPTSPTGPAEAKDPADATPPPELPDPTADFDTLYELTATGLVRQTYLLTGHRRLACEAVAQAFQHAWRHWPEVAADPDPAAWVRAVAHEYATSPWHRFRPSRNRRGAPLPHRQDRELLGVLTELPVSYRRTLVLHDCLGLALPQTAAETESSTAATAGRLGQARLFVGDRLPELRPVENLRERLAQLSEASSAEGPGPERTRQLSERRTRQWTRAAIGLTAAVVIATVVTLNTAPTRYEPPVPDGRPVGGAPPQMGPQAEEHQDAELRDQLTTGPDSGPERLLPQLP